MNKHNLWNKIDIVIVMHITAYLVQTERLFHPHEIFHGHPKIGPGWSSMVHPSV